MDTILIKILAVFLALSQVTTRPDNIKTRFDATLDTGEVTQILRDGCGHIRKAFDVESLDLDDLIKTAMDDPTAFSVEVKSLHGLKFDSLLAVYKQFCNNEDLKDSPVDLSQVIDFFNGAVADLPDHSRLKGTRFLGTGGVLDAKGERFADLTESNRRVWVPLKDIPLALQKAFVAAEDKRFYEHKGIDERGLIRAMVANLARPGRPQGGSTITQQVVKNLLVGDDVTYERKIREMIIASWVERSLTKQEILELYLNSIYLGRGAWGVELAARNYFGKPVSGLTLQESAMLAGMPKGPTYYSPDRHPERTQERLSYVLSRMQEDGDTAAGALVAQKVSLPRMVTYEHTAQRDSGYYFLDFITREARALPNVNSIATVSTTIRTTIRPDLQRAAEVAIQEGLAQYEINNNRVEWRGPEMNLAEAVKRIESKVVDAAPAPAKPVRAGRRGRAAAVAPAEPVAGNLKTANPKPAWQQALLAARPPLYDVHWSNAIVLPTRGGGTRIGLADGRTVGLSSAGSVGRDSLSDYDVVLVKITESNGRLVRADLRARPTVQGAAIVLDNRTGAILAMVGGFSYPVSQLNRATQAQRQPGSALKPFTYLAALSNGLQPNTLVKDEPFTLPPLGNPEGAQEKDYWSPKNADAGNGGVTTLRRGLEFSKNLVTAHLLDGGIDGDPSRSLARVCQLTLEAQIYRDCVARYPFVLGAQPARLINVAAFYAAIATEGHRPQPYSIESIDQNGRNLYKHAPDLKWLAGGDRPAFFQLKTMLQGVVARGTARAIADLSPYVGGKTGTSDDENDAWFVGFTNEVTVGVWVGYDNADGKRRTLGSGQSGGRVSVPIFRQIVEAVWAQYTPKTAINPPSPEAQRELLALPIDLASGRRTGKGGFTEYFRIRGGMVQDTANLLVAPGDGVAVARGPVDGGGGGGDRYQPQQQVRRGGGDDDGRAARRAARAAANRRQQQDNPGGNNFAGGGNQGGGDFFGFNPTPTRGQRPRYSGGGQFGEFRPQYQEERWNSFRRVDPDYPWRQR